jgi:hypothetical protein
MAGIDITVSPQLEQMFQLPTCASITLPNASSLSIQLPTGGSLQAFADISKGIPTDCSMTFSLMLQLAPFIASIQCLLNILKLLKPLIDIIKGLPLPPSPSVIGEFISAAGALAPCLLIPTPAIMIPFILDLLCLILKVLNCFLTQIQSVINILETIESQLAAATQSGNSELLGMLTCAQQNAQTQAGQIMLSLGPVGALLEVAGPLFGIAGIPAISIPSLGATTDLASLQNVINTMQEVVSTVENAISAVGACS